mmetsp:Transcript_62685/g.161319  ORF Transcript_62685/g.161319 Transcript_62685/m.161319 type:complete len:240 (+) Transcript_62685:1056-1775(+)
MSQHLPELVAKPVDLLHDEDTGRVLVVQRLVVQVQQVPQRLQHVFRVPRRCSGAGDWGTEVLSCVAAGLAGGPGRVGLVRGARLVGGGLRRGSRRRAQNGLPVARSLAMAHGLEHAKQRGLSIRLICHGSNCRGGGRRRGARVGDDALRGLGREHDLDGSTDEVDQLRARGCCGHVAPAPAGRRRGHLVAARGVRRRRVRREGPALRRRGRGDVGGGDAGLLRRRRRSGRLERRRRRRG